MASGDYAQAKRLLEQANVLLDDWDVSDWGEGDGAATGSEDAQGGSWLMHVHTN